MNISLLAETIKDRSLLLSLVLLCKALPSPSIRNGKPARESGTARRSAGLSLLLEVSTLMNSSQSRMDCYIMATKLSSDKLTP